MTSLKTKLTLKLDIAVLQSPGYALQKQFLTAVHCALKRPWSDCGLARVKWAC